MSWLVEPPSVLLDEEDFHAPALRSQGQRHLGQSPACPVSRRLMSWCYLEGRTWTGVDFTALCVSACLFPWVLPARTGVSWPPSQHPLLQGQGTQGSWPTGSHNPRDMENIAELGTVISQKQP